VHLRISGTDGIGVLSSYSFWCDGGFGRSICSSGNAAFSMVVESTRRNSCREIDWRSAKRYWLSNEVIGGSASEGVSTATSEIVIPDLAPWDDSLVIPR